MVSSDYIYHVLRQEILSLELLPGTQVREEELAELKKAYEARVAKRFPAKPQLREVPAAKQGDETVFLV